MTNKLTNEIKSSICEKYQSGKYSHSMLAKEFNLHKSSIYRILTEKNIRNKYYKFNLSGLKFGKLNVISQCPIKTRYGDRYWNCICDCGNIKSAGKQQLLSGRTKSCGCLKSETNRKTFKGHNDISGTFFNSIRRRALNNSIDFSISIEYIWELFLEQNRKCALSGIDLILHSHLRTSNTITASLDRIDNNKGYVKGNVQWLHKDINMMKHAHIQDYFIKMCHLIAKQNPISLSW